MKTDNVNDSDQLQAMTKEQLIGSVIELRAENSRLKSVSTPETTARLKLQSVKDALRNTLDLIET